MRSLRFAGMLTLAPVIGQSPAVELPDDAFAALAELPQAAPVSGGLEVVVRDAAGEPAPDAIVVLMSVTDADYAAWREAAELRDPGDAVRSDRLASVFRSKVGRQGGSRVVLTLHPAWSFTVAVVTADGAPADGVALGLLDSADAFPFSKVTTGTDGRATFRAIPGRPVDTAMIRVLIASREPVTCTMPAADGGQARLQLPRCGSITATLAGELLPGSAVKWSLQSADPAWAEASPEVAGSGSATFRIVEAGFCGEVRCSIQGGGSRSVAVAELQAGAELAVTVATA